MLLFSALLLALPAVAGQPVVPPPIVTTASGLRLQVLEEGRGRQPARGDAVLVRYEGRLADGRVFDAPTEPVGLRVSDLVPGFTEALLLMREGGRYNFWLPPRLAYGAQGMPGTIPPNAELQFTLTLIRVGHAAGH